MAPSQFYHEAVQTGEKKPPASLVQIDVPKRSIDAFVVSAPSFEQCVMNWVVEIYQPLRCVEDKTFMTCVFL